MNVTLRTVRLGDAETLAELYRANRDFLRPWEPTRDEAFFTAEGQLEDLRRMVEAEAIGRMWPALIFADGVTVGRITLHNIIRGSLQSCYLGYWVAKEHGGRGVATEAVRLSLDVAFNELFLHRVEAFTRLDNVVSQRVLLKNGFSRVGVARRHIHVDGRWHDEQLFEKLAPWDDGVSLLPLR